MVRVGLISDTHGLLRPEALDFLQGSAHIVHGGDIGDVAILERLASIAPLTVVRGDTAPWAESLPHTARLQLGPVSVLVVHDLNELAVDAAAAPVRVIVSGHSHRPSCEERGGVLYVNPGSAGRRRFSLPIALGELFVDGEHVRANIVTL